MAVHIWIFGKYHSQISSLYSSVKYCNSLYPHFMCSVCLHTCAREQALTLWPTRSGLLFTTAL